MVKYMFRESLPLARERFGRYVEDKANFARIPHAKRQLEVVSHLVRRTFDAYGEVGIYDPERLATIDFLNQPRLLVDLVDQSAARGQAAGRAGCPRTRAGALRRVK